MRNKISIGLSSLLAPEGTKIHRKDTLSISNKTNDLSKEFSKLGSKLSREDVHRLRISTRRLRALFQVLSQDKMLKVGKTLRKRVKFLTDRLGETRSLDVSLKLWKRRFGTRKALEFVSAELRHSARQSRRRLLKYLEKKSGKTLQGKIEKLLPRLEAHPEAYQEAWLKACVQTRKRARRDYHRYRTDSRMESLHQLRIRFKQWRYLLEWDSSKDPEARAIEILKSLQDDIGDLHDLEVLGELLKKSQIKSEARKAGAGQELQALRDELKSEIRTGQRTFVMRQRRALKEIFA